MNQPPLNLAKTLNRNQLPLEKKSYHSTESLHTKTTQPPTESYLIKITPSPHLGGLRTNPRLMNTQTKRGMVLIWEEEIRTGQKQEEEKEEPGKKTHFTGALSLFPSCSPKSPPPGRVPAQRGMENGRMDGRPVLFKTAPERNASGL